MTILSISNAQHNETQYILGHSIKAAQHNDTRHNDILHTIKSAALNANLAFSVAMLSVAFLIAMLYVTAQKVL
jgi:hypothetical protein